MIYQTKSPRRDFPWAASMGDKLREDFPEARVTYAKENGHEYGYSLGTAVAMVTYPVAENPKDRLKRQRAGLEQPTFSFMV